MKVEYSEMSSIQMARAEMEQFPKDTKIFMFVLFILICGFFGFIFSAWVEIFWVQLAATFVGVGIGALLGYKICLQDMLTNKDNEHDETNTLETAIKPISASDEDRLEELDRRERKRRIRFNTIMGAWGVSLVISILIIPILGATGENDSTVPILIGCVAYFVGNIIVAIATVIIISNLSGRYKPKNPARAEGIITGSVLIGGGAKMSHRVGVAVLSIDKLLISYVKTTSAQDPYKKGDKVIVEYNFMKPKKCRILPEEEVR